MTSPTIRSAIAALSFLAITACAGADGATGPQGPAGPTGTNGTNGTNGAQGPQGPAGAPGAPGAPGALNRADLTGTFDASGSVRAALPATAVANGRVPVIVCYVSNTRQTWINVSQVPSVATDPYCGLAGIGGAAPVISLINGTPGWFYYIIAVW